MYSKINGMNLRYLLLACLSILASLSLKAQINQQYVSYIETYKELAIEQMERYHIPASITLAQGLFESAAGQSALSLRSNNHFGIKCGTGWNGKKTYHDDDASGECFRVYSSVRASYEDHSLFLKNRSRYASLFDLSQTDYRGWAHGLKKAGYATNPQYAQRLIDIIERYRLYEYDRMTSKAVRTGVEMKMENLQGAYNERQVRLNNGLLLVVAREGETLSQIAAEFGVKEKKLIKYNDLYKGYRLSEGEYVYLEKKKRMASKEFFRQSYRIQAGDSMHRISQAFGIRLKNLYKMNNMSPEDALPKIGTPIRIR